MEGTKVSTTKSDTTLVPPKCGACRETVVTADAEVCAECIRDGLEFAASEGWLDPEPGETVH